MKSSLSYELHLRIMSSSISCSTMSASNSHSSTFKVTPHSKLTTVSSKPIEPGKRHPFSVVDHALSHHTLHMIFYYKDTDLSESFELDPLRESLAAVLSLYPPVTGRLARDKEGNWEVRCNDAGVRVIKAKVDATIDEWLTSVDGFQERDLTAWEQMPDDPQNWSPFQTQINEFKEGIAIGLSCPHMHADPTCATLIFKSWTETHSREPISHPPFFIPSALCGRPCPNPSMRSSATHFANKSSKKAKLEKPPVKMASSTFRFSNSVLKQCLSEVHHACPQATPFGFLTALFWTRIARLKPSKTNGQNTHSISICIDTRNKLNPPLPCGYFGNALHFSQLSLDVEDMHYSKLGHVTSAIHKHMEAGVEEEIRSAIDWLESQRAEGKLPPPTCMYGPELTCVNMEHMIMSSSGESWMYEAMFSKEKPVHVSCYVGNVEGEGLITVMPSPEGGFARTVTLMLPEEEHAALCKDQAILGLEPMILFASRSKSD